MKIKKMVYSAIFLAIGLVLPLLTAQIKEIGDSLLPMHIPVLLCGFVCGFGYGGTVGLLLPLLRALLFGMPPIYPNALWMAAELAAYGLVAGLLYALRRKPSIGYTYLCLISAMLAGRAVWGVTKAALLGLGGKPFPISAFWIGGFADALPGIILQLLLIPITVKLLERLTDRSTV